MKTSSATYLRLFTYLDDVQWLAVACRKFQWQGSKQGYNSPWVVRGGPIEYSFWVCSPAPD